MSKAMALRIKYRTKTDAGQIKRRLPLLTLSVHPENRGGVYPQGDDVKQLAIRLAKAGFSQEEADRQGVCVQKPPAAAVAVGYTQYNQQHCQGSDVLSACFGKDAQESQEVSQHTSAASGSNDAQALQEVSQDGLKYCRNINAVAARVIREHAGRGRTRQLLRKKEADSVFENLGDQHQMDERGKAIRR